MLEADKKHGAHNHQWSMQLQYVCINKEIYRIAADALLNISNMDIIKFYHTQFSYLKWSMT